MSGAKTPGGKEQGGADPSMEDILASIRRILSEDEPQAATLAPAAPQAGPAAEDDVLVLDSSMEVPEGAEPPPLSTAPIEDEPDPAPAAAAPDPDPFEAAVVPEPPAPDAPAPRPAASDLLAPETAAAAASAVSGLVRTLASERSTHVYAGGPTIEDLVRAELRPLLKEWLDTFLPDLVERLVRAEIERVIRRAVP